MSRYTVIAWQRGSYGIVDNEASHGTPERFLGRGFQTRREADAEARRLNREHERETKEAESK